MTPRRQREAATVLPACLAALLVVLVCAGLARAATFTVDSTADGAGEVDDNPGDGTCATAGAVCTVRAAIQEANALAGVDTISRSVTGTITVAAVTLSADPLIVGLPALTEGAIIDWDDGVDCGALPGGASPAPALTLQGSGSLTHGLRFENAETYIVRGLGITGLTNTGAAALVAQGGTTLTVACGTLTAGYHGLDCRSDCTVTDTLIDGNAVDGLFCVGGTITAERVLATDNEDGAYLSGCDGVSITDSHLTGNSHNGVNLDDNGSSGSDNATLTNITATGNGEQGVNVQDNSDGLTLTASTLGANTQYGVALSADSNGASITGNDFTDPACNGINDYLDAGGNTFSGNTECPDPTPTPTPPVGCCEFGNASVESTTLTCGDSTFMGGLPDFAACEALVAIFDTPGPGTPTPFAIRYVADAACFPDPFTGGCPADTATATATATATPTVTATGTVTDTPTATATATGTSTETPTVTATGTVTDTPTQTATATGTVTDTPTATATSTETGTATDTPTATATETPTATSTGTVTDTPTSTATETGTATQTATATTTPTATPTPTDTPTGLASPTATKAKRLRHYKIRVPRVRAVPG